MLRNICFFAIAALSVAVNSLFSIELSLEAKAGYFQPESGLFKEIYGGGGIYGGDLGCRVWKNFHAWIGASSFTKEGHTKSQHSKTKIDLTPIVFGVKHLSCFEVCNQTIGAYAGLGVQYTHINIRNFSPYVPQHIHQWKAGGIAKVGAIYSINANWFLDVFIDYSFLKMNYRKHDHQVVVAHDASLNGWIFGVGAGYKFCLGAGSLGR